MIKSRTLKLTLEKAIKTFPAVLVTGPRQSGKTTLLKTAFSKTHKFVSLENPDIRLRAKEDPLLFLSQYKTPVIIDEIQYAPELFSYIKTMIDENRKPGQWLFTGSQNFILSQKISQSLAGRICILNLMPFSYSEFIDRAESTLNISGILEKIKKEGVNVRAKNKEVDIYKLLLRGFYPEINVNKKIDTNLWCGSYISTYLERDIRNIANIENFTQFEIFLKTCAVYTGQILNLSNISRDIGVSVTTIKRWLSILEASYQIFLIYPYYKNFGKRFVKSPKIYFSDVGLINYLLGIKSKEMLISYSNFGFIFETFIIVDFIKKFMHFGEKPSIYYIKTPDGLEVDMVIESGDGIHLFEIKSAMTITSKHSSSLTRIIKDFKGMVKTASIISLSQDNFALTPSIINYSWKNIIA